MYCVYLTVYFGNKLPRRYIGSTKVERIKCGYNGSIKSKKYKAVYYEEQVNNKHLFKTRILSKHHTQEEAVREELRLHIKYDVVKSSTYMNMALATINGCFGMDINGDNHPMYNKHHSDETKKRISEKLKQKYKNGELITPFASLDTRGENNPFYGRIHTDETKNKMRKPKMFVPKFKCPHCDKMYDSGNLKQHMLRLGYSNDDYESAKTMG